MPKETRTEKEIKEVKERILDAAIKLMTDVGFNNFSMRKLASRVNMTAANIYNYYVNKDELYLDIQTNGFQMLYDRFKEIYETGNEPVEILKEFASAYISFGIDNAECYDIMFNRDTPKYTDYIGTDFEPIALLEKQTALEVAKITTKVINELKKKNTTIKIDDPEYRTIQIWSSLHGIVTLYNSRVLQEVEAMADDIIKRFTEDLLLMFIKDTDK